MITRKKAQGKFVAKAIDFIDDSGVIHLAKENIQKREIAKAIKRCIRKRFKFNNAKMVNSYFGTWNGQFYGSVIYINGKEFSLDRVTIMEINEIKKEG